MKILSIIGQQGTGKSTIGRIIAEKESALFVEASDVVRILCGDISREEMPLTNARTATEPYWLAEGIHKYINALTTIPIGFVVLTGVREPEVHEGLIRLGCYSPRVIKLWLPEQERYARVLQRTPETTYEEFKRHDENELSIGLDKLLAQHFLEVIPYNSPHDSAFIAWKLAQSLWT